MSALDDVISQFPFDASDNVSREAHDRFLKEAREELELLRDTHGAAFELLDAIRMRLDENCRACGFSGGEGSMREEPHGDKCPVARILRTDPERAKAMGLWWAL